MSGASEGLAKVMRALNYIPKEASQGVSYKFRSVDAVFNEIHLHLAEAGLVLVPKVLDDWQLNMIPGTNNRMQSQALFRLQVDVVAEDGTTETIGVGLAQSHDYGDKAVYQAQQNAIKYVLIEAFAIPTGDRDMDSADSGEVPAVTEPRERTAWEWLWNEGAIFKAWTTDQRRDAIQLAVDALAITSGAEMTRDEADRVFSHIQGQYTEADQAELPV